MPESNPVTSSVRSRYLTAIAILVIFIIALFSVDAFVSNIITSFFPNLDPYIIYGWEASNALMGIVGSYIIYRILVSVVKIRAAKKKDPASAEVQKLILRVLFSFIAIVITLTSFGVSLSGALAGGAIGGVIIGLAVQTVTTSILSGFLVSTSRTLLPGDTALMKSSYWGGVDLMIKITRVSTLYTEGITQNGNIMKFPNPLLLNYTILTHLREKEGLHLYPLQILLNPDVPAKKLEEKARANMAGEFKKMRLPIPEIVFASKGTQGSQLNSFNVLIRFNDISEINKLAGIVNHAFDDAYWSVKK